MRSLYANLGGLILVKQLVFILIMTVSLVAAPVLADASKGNASSQTPVVLKIDTSEPQSSDLLRNDQSFPQTVLNTDRSDGWRVNGYSDGNSLGVRQATDPLTGEPVLEFWLKGRNIKKPWLNWVRQFPAGIARKSLQGFSFEIWPITPVPASLVAELGLPLKIKDIGAAFRGRVGDLTPGQWNKVTFSSGSSRHPYPQGFRMYVNISRSDVQLNEEIRFLVRNMTLLPRDPDSPILTNPFSIPVHTQSPIEAAWLQVDSTLELDEKESAHFLLDLSIEGSDVIDAQLNLTLLPTTLGAKANLNTLKQSVTLTPPFTRLKIQRAAMPAGSYQLSIELKTSKGTILETSKQTKFTWFDREIFEQELARQKERLASLQDRAKALSARGIRVAEPGVSLETADIFLSDYLRDDYYRQNERGIAGILLEQVRQLLAKADMELTERQAGTFQELAIPHQYDADLPLEIRDGRLYQNNNPVLLFGPQLSLASANKALPHIRDLGFNSVLIETQPTVFTEYGQDQPLQVSREAQQRDLAVELLFSTHYMDNLPGHAAVGHVMLPYDILNPEVRPLLAKAYNKILSPLDRLTNLISVGTANEPGYAIRTFASSYEQALGQWLTQRYNQNIKQLNEQWRTRFDSFSQITLKDVIPACKDNPAISYDWESFRAQLMGGHFQFMKDQVLDQLPGRMVWVKKYHRFGFGQIDPEVLFDQGATSFSWSSILWPFSTDYARGLAPDAPISCTEWKLVPGFTPTSLDANPKAGTLRIFENYARGVSQGIIWKWPRRRWRAMGDHYTFTRYPTAMDELGRTGLRLQQLAPVFDRLGQLGDGTLAVLFDKASLLHQGKSYLNPRDPSVGLLSQYWQLGRSSEGVRVLHAGRAEDADFVGRRLIAAGSVNALRLDTMHQLRDWVSQGGTLWLSVPGSLALDPWGNAHKDESVLDLVTAAAQFGEHSLGSGKVIVDPDWTGYEAFLEGPYPVNAKNGASMVHDVECRLAPSQDQGPAYFYLLNRTAMPQDVRLCVGTNQATWTLPASAKEIWKQDSTGQPATQKTVFNLQPYDVLLFEIPATDIDLDNAKAK